MADMAIALELAGRDAASGPINAVRSALGGLGPAAQQANGIGAAAAQAHAAALGGINGAVGAAKEAVGGFGESLRGVFSLAQGFALGGGILQIPSVLEKFTQAAENAELGQTRLETAVKASGGSFEEYQSRISAAVASGKQLAFGGGEVKDALTTLINETQSTDEAMSRLTVAENFSRGAKIDLSTAARLLGRVTDESASALGRYGIHVEKGTDATQVMAEVMQRFGGQAEAFGNTSAGQAARVQAQFGALSVTLGQAILPVFVALGGITANILAPAISSVLVPAFQMLGTVLSGVAQGITGVVMPLSQQLQPAFQAISTTIRGFLAPAIDVVKGLFAAFTVDAGAMGIVIASLRKMFGDTVADALDPFIHSFMLAIPSIREFAGTVMSNLGQALGSLWQSLQPVVAAVGQFARDNLPALGAVLAVIASDAALGGFSSLLDLIGPALATAAAAFGGFVVSLGVALAPVALLTAEFRLLFELWNRDIGGVQEKFAALTGVLGPALRTLGSIAQQALGGDLAGALARLGPLLQGVGAQLGPMLQSWAAEFGAWAQRAIPPMVASLGQLTQQLLGWLGQQLGPIAATVGQWAQAFIGWVGPLIPPFLAELGALAQQLWGWIQQVTPVVLQQLAQWATAFVQWIGPMIPPFLEQLGVLAQQFLGWLGEQIPPILQQLGQWGLQFIAWVAPQIPPMLTALAGLAGQLLGWAASQVGPILSQLGQWGLQFIQWIGPQIPPMLEALGGLVGSMLGWIAGQAVVLGVKLVTEWIPAFLGWISGGGPGGGDSVVAQAPSKLGEFLGAVGGWIRDVGAPGLLNMAIALGTAVLGGIKAGLAGFGSAFKQAIIDALGPIDFRVGPFHFTSGGVSVSLPSVQLPGGASPAPADGGQHGPGAAALVMPGQTGPGDGGGSALGNVSAFTHGTSQFGIGLSHDEAMAACGPFAALSFAAAIGRYPSAAEAVALARRVGWTPGTGMAGPASELTLLGSMGIDAVQQSASAANIDAALSAGRPVAISTPNHYFVASGGSAAGGLDVGSTGSIFKGGGSTLTLSQIASLGGGLQSIIVLSDQAVQAVSKVADIAPQIAAAPAAAAQAALTPFQKFQASLQPIVEQMSAGTAKAGAYETQLVGLANAVGLTPEPFKRLFEGTEDSRAALEDLATRLATTVNPQFGDLLTQLHTGQIGTNEFAARFLDMASKVQQQAGTTVTAVTGITTSVDNLVDAGVAAARNALGGKGAAPTAVGGKGAAGDASAIADQTAAWQQVQQQIGLAKQAALDYKLMTLSISTTPELFQVTAWGKVSDAIKDAIDKAKEYASLAGGAVQAPEGRASGGLVMAGHPYLVGERGPELITPGVDSYVTPHSAVAGGGFGPTEIHYHAHGVDPSDEANLRNLLRRAAFDLDAEQADRDRAGL